MDRAIEARRRVLAGKAPVWHRAIVIILSLVFSWAAVAALLLGGLFLWQSAWTSEAKAEEGLRVVEFDVVRIENPYLTRAQAHAALQVAKIKYREAGIDMRIRRQRVSNLVPTQYMNLNGALKAFWEYHYFAVTQKWRRGRRVIVLAPPLIEPNGDRYTWGFGFTNCARNGFAVAGIQATNNRGEDRMLHASAAILHETMHSLWVPTRFKGEASLSHVNVLGLLPESWRFSNWDLHRIKRCVGRHNGTQFGD